MGNCNSVPFYAGIFGLFKFTALTTVVTQAFVAISTPSTYLLIIYWYAGLLNYLIPSVAANGQ